MRTIAFALAIGLTTTIAPAAPVVWSADAGGNGHAYDVIVAPQGISWADASHAAGLLGGRLVTLETPAENAFVFSLIVSEDDAWVRLTLDDGRVIQLGPWIGLAQDEDAAEPAGGWRWVTGAPVAVALWSPREPNDRHHRDGAESRAHYFGWDEVRTPFWNDMPERPAGTGGEPGLRVAAFVVEYEPDSH